jgi:hypothetical protein
MKKILGIEYDCEDHGTSEGYIVCLKCFSDQNDQNELCDRLIKFVKSISDNFSLDQSDYDSLKFLALKEYEAYKILEETGLLK